MAQFAATTNLATWYAHLDVDSILERWRSELSNKEIRQFEHRVAQAHGKDSTKALTKLAGKVDGEYRIISDPPLVVPIRELAGEAGAEGDGDQLWNWLRDRFRLYRRSVQPNQRRLLESYRIVDFARKVVGVGSVGTRCWIALLVGKDESDPLFLQIKEAEHSVLERYAGKSTSAATDDASWRASGCSRSRATSSSAGSAPRVSTVSSATSTSASSGTGRCRRTSKRSRLRS